MNKLLQEDGRALLLEIPYTRADFSRIDNVVFSWGAYV